MGDSVNFQDLFKKSVLDLEAFKSVSLLEVLLGLFISFCIGMFIFYIYQKSFRGVVYSYNYNVTFVLMTMITTMIIMTISTNIVLSLGMVGALSIVRFRTAVKDPMDIVYMFWSISAGIATGAKIYPISVFGSLVTGLTIYWLSRHKIRENPFMLIIQYEIKAHGDVMSTIRKLKYTLKSKTVRQEIIELSVEIKLRDDNTYFVNVLSDTDGVKDVMLVSYNGDYAP